MSHSKYAESVAKMKLPLVHGRDSQPDLIYNVICDNHGNHHKCLGRFTRKSRDVHTLCPNCIRLKKRK